MAIRKVMEVYLEFLKETCLELHKEISTVSQAFILGIRKETLTVSKEVIFILRKETTDTATEVEIWAINKDIGETRKMV